MDNRKMTDNYYTLLGVSPQASTAEIIAAYNERRRQGDDDPARESQLGAAVDVLTDSEKRRRYDAEQDVQPPVEKSGVSGRELLYGVIGVLVGLLVLSGVWLLSGRDSTPTASLSEVPAYDAPEFVLQDLQGQPVKLSDYQGKVVLINFWGTWCEPCKQETPALQASYEKLQADGLVVIGVNLLNSERAYKRTIDDVRQFAALYGVSYPIVLDDSGSAAQAYGIAPLPTSYFIDQQGKVRYIRVGELSAADVEHVFRRLHTNNS